MTHSPISDVGPTAQKGILNRVTEFNSLSALSCALSCPLNEDSHLSLPCAGPICSWVVTLLHGFAREVAFGLFNAIGGVGGEPFAILYCVESVN